MTLVFRRRTQIFLLTYLLPHKHRRLVDDSLAHWQPVQANKNWHDVVVTMSPGDQVGCRCRVLHKLESPKINISDPGQNRVAVVQPTTKMKAWTKARVASVVRDRQTDRS